MRSIKVGIYDEEAEYVKRLSAYLNRKGNGKWLVFGYTSKELLGQDVMESRLDAVFGTNRQVLFHIRKQCEKLPLLWLTEEEKVLSDLSCDVIPLFRYQSAAVLADVLENIVMQVVAEEKCKMPIVCFYSPVGRCGKTEFALQLAKRGQYGKWFYIGMEDYSFLWAVKKTSQETENDISDRFLYYIKERDEKQLVSLLRESKGMILSAFSLFDTKCMMEEDFQWLLQCLQKMEDCSGVVFDIGTGVLSEIFILKLFDYVVVPFIQEEKAMQKLEQFNDLISAYGLDQLKERFIYVNMESEEDKNIALERIRNGGWKI